MDLPALRLSRSIPDHCRRLAAPRNARYNAAMASGSSILTALTVTMAVSVRCKLAFIQNDRQTLIGLAILAGITKVNAVAQARLARTEGTRARSSHVDD